MVMMRWGIDAVDDCLWLHEHRKKNKERREKTDRKKLPSDTGTSARVVEPHTEARSQDAR